MKRLLFWVLLLLSVIGTPVDVVRVAESSGFELIDKVEIIAALIGFEVWWLSLLWDWSSVDPDRTCAT